MMGMLKDLKSQLRAAYRTFRGFSHGPGGVENLLSEILASKGLVDSPSYFVQVGAGPGDLDSGSGFRDGFTGVIKNLPLGSLHKVLLVEPNPFNIPSLRECWKGFPSASIFELGIVQREVSGRSLPFYYTELDGPHFNVASFNSHHVLKHYKSLKLSDLRVLEIPTTDLRTFLDRNTHGAPILLLALDIEGIDAEIILETDFSSIDIRLISFERIHLGRKAGLVHRHLRKCGFQYHGLGVDHNGLDHLYLRVID